LYFVDFLLSWDIAGMNRTYKTKTLQNGPKIEQIKKHVAKTDKRNRIRDRGSKTKQKPNKSTTIAALFAVWVKRGKEEEEEEEEEKVLFDLNVIVLEKIVIKYKVSFDALTPSLLVIKV